MNDRQQKIFNLLSNESQLSVNSLLEATQSSPATIRRDLQLLEQAGRIERFHGGARLSRKNHYELSFEKRAQLRIRQKRAIARIAADFVKKDDTLILSAGSTTLYIARVLSEQKKQVNIITNNLFIIQEAANFPSFKLNLLGGTIDYANMESMGPTALENVRRHAVDKVFIGVNGLSSKHGGTSIYEQNAHLYRTMTEVADEVFVVADSNKFTAKAAHVAVPIHRLDHLITDNQADPQVIAAFEAQAVKVHGL